ncbi:MAG TPA: patatin-like phospholipase family protein [Bacteroidales bacterium]|nr:patatin-like phospholipase family protein [Bacteroidales bacterium]
MNRGAFSFILLALIISTLSFVSDRNSRRVSIPLPSRRSGTAIILTGAAARIPQEAALLEELYNRGLLRNVVFISGVSSGALNAVALNAILSGKMTWAEYRKILFSIHNSDIFTQGEKRKLPVNTEPERKFLTEVFEKKLGYHSIGDLKIPTSVSFTELKHIEFRREVFRICSRKINNETDTTLNLVDILMASTAFPIAFPPARIRNSKTIPDAEYIDGGVGEDHVPFRALFEFEQKRGMGVEKVFIISRKSDSIPAVSEELKVLGINDKGIFDKMGVSMDNILQRGIYRRLIAYSELHPEMIRRTWIWVPDFRESFLMFNFDKLQEQYQVTSAWAKTHDPEPIGNFLLPYLLLKKGEYSNNY